MQDIYTKGGVDNKFSSLSPRYGTLYVGNNKKTSEEE